MNNPLAPALTIARFTLVEALRNRLLWLLLAIALAALALAGFLGAVALTEGRQIQAALVGAGLRLACVFLTMLFVAGSLQREANERGLELLLSLPMPRAAYLLGKLAGFFALALFPALLAGGLLLPFAAWQQCALWAVSLLCELWIVAAFTALCALGLRQGPAALAASAAFYLLARSLAGLQAIGHGPYQGDAARRWLAAGVDLLAAVLPRLDQFTRSDWLVYHDPVALVPVLAQTAIYVALLAAAALADLYRRAI